MDISKLLKAIADTIERYGVVEVKFFVDLPAVRQREEVTFSNVRFNPEEYTLNINLTFEVENGKHES
jgi:hypothetical protein